MAVLVCGTYKTYTLYLRRHHRESGRQYWWSEPLAPVPGYHAALPGFFRLPLARGNKVGAEAKHLTQPERIQNKPSFGHKKLSEGVLL